MPEQKEEQKIFFNIEKVDETWQVRGQFERGSMKDTLDFIMILLTNAVRLALTLGDVERSHKNMKKALTSQLHDIINAEIREARNAKRTKSEEEKIPNPNGEEVRES